MQVLVIDVGGTHVKLMHSGSPDTRKFDSGDGFTPQQVVAGVKANTADWKYDVITLGIPSPVLRGRVMEEPWNLGKGWVEFDWAGAFGVPVKIPPPSLCTDNAAMIGSAARWVEPVPFPAYLGLDAYPTAA